MFPKTASGSMGLLLRWYSPRSLVRSSGVIDKYEFGKLSEDKTAVLIKKLYNRDDIHKPMTLAEIFNMDSENHGAQKERERIGF